MTPNPQTSGWWDPLAESPEEAQARREADAKYVAEVESADFWAAAGDFSRSLWIGEVDAETGMQTVDQVRREEEWDTEDLDLILGQLDWLEWWEEGYDDTLYDPSSPEAEIYQRIASRIDTELWGNPEVLVPELFEEEARDRNFERANALFFSEEALNEQMRNTWDGSEAQNLEANRAWLDTNMWENWVLALPFERIQENFVLPPNIEGSTLQEIYENGSTDDVLTVNNALADAFLLEVQQHTLAGRINYPREQVEELMREIVDPETSPFEKLQLFWQIHTLVETGVGGRGRKQTEAFRNSQRRAAINQERSDAFYVAQAERIEAAERDNRPRDDEEQVIEEDTEWGWDIFTASALDITNDGEQAKETA